MPTYQASTPRVAFAIAAAAMTAITMSVFVVMPAGMPADAHWLQSSTLASSKVDTGASASAVPVARIDVAAVREPGSATARTRHPTAAAAHKVE